MTLTAAIRRTLPRRRGLGARTRNDGRRAPLRGATTGDDRAGAAARAAVWDGLTLQRPPLAKAARPPTNGRSRPSG